MDVLIIESDGELATRLSAALRERGVGAAVFADGEAALERARQQHPAAVVLALELGDKPSAGFSWCNRFKRDESLRNVPLVLTSTLATAETFEHHQRLKTRADAYLHKPYSPDQLLASLETWLQMDAPPAGSTSALADELLGEDEEEFETIDPDEVQESESLDELFADLGGAEDFEKTIVAFPRDEAASARDEVASAQDDRAAAPFPAARESSAVRPLVESRPAVSEVPLQAEESTPGPEGDFFDLADLRGRVAELEARLESVDRELSDRDRAVARLREEQDDSEARLRGAQQHADDADAQNRKLEATLSVVRADAGRLPDLEERIATLEAQVAAQGSDLASSRGEAAALQERLGEAEGELTRALEELEAAKGESGDRAAQVVKLREEWERTAAELEQVAADLERTRAERDDRSEQLEQARADAEDGRQELAARDTELAARDTELAALQGDLAEARAALEAAHGRQQRAQEAVAALQAILADGASEG